MSELELIILGCGDLHSLRLFLPSMDHPEVEDIGFEFDYVLGVTVNLDLLGRLCSIVS
jgi:hypothetical protein